MTHSALLLMQKSESAFNFNTFYIHNFTARQETGKTSAKVSERTSGVAALPLVCHFGNSFPKQCCGFSGIGRAKEIVVPMVYIPYFQASGNLINPTI